jgi:hypothetical protein
MAIVDPWGNNKNKTVPPQEQLPLTGKGIIDPLEAGNQPSTMGPITGIEGEYAGKFSPEYVQQMLDEMSGPGKLWGGIGGGAYILGKGAQQLGAETGELVGLVKPETVKEITRQTADARDFLDLMESKSNAVGAGEFIGQTLPMLPLPGGVAGGAVKRGLTAALQGATVGGLQYVPEGGNRLTNTLAAAALGGLTSAVPSAITKSVNAVRSAKIPPTIAERQAAQWKIPITTGEALGDTARQRTEVLLERAPGLLGIKDFRIRQNEAAKQAAKDFLGKYIVDPDAVDIGLANRKYVSGIYEEVKGLVKQTTEPVSVRNTFQSAHELLKRYPNTFKIMQDKKTENILGDIISGAIKKKGRLSFDEMWQLRKGLGDKIGQARILFARGKVDKTQYEQLMKLHQAVTDDLDSWATNIKRPDIMEKFKAANQAYKDYVVKYDAVQRAYDKASGERSALEVFSPKTFSTALKKEAYAAKTTGKFSPIEISEMAGLANIMQVVKRAGQFMENPPTGNRYGPLVAMAEVVASPSRWKGMALGVMSEGIAKFLATSKVGKNLSRAASKIEPNSPAMSAVMRQVYQQSGKFVEQEYFRRQREPIGEQGSGGNDWSNITSYPPGFDLRNPETWPPGFGSDEDLARAEEAFKVPEGKRRYGSPE